MRTRERSSRAFHDFLSSPTACISPDITTDEDYQDSRVARSRSEELCPSRIRQYTNVGRKKSSEERNNTQLCLFRFNRVKAHDGSHKQSSCIEGTQDLDRTSYAVIRYIDDAVSVSAD